MMMVNIVGHMLRDDHSVLVVDMDRGKMTHTGTDTQTTWGDIERVMDKGGDTIMLIVIIIIIPSSRAILRARSYCRPILIIDTHRREATTKLSAAFAN